LHPVLGRPIGQTSLLLLGLGLSGGERAEKKKNQKRENMRYQSMV
jgi:hypothetical protein